MCKSILLSSPEANLLGVRGIELQQKHWKIQGDYTCLDCMGSGQDKEIIVKSNDLHEIETCSYLSKLCRKYTNCCK